MSRVPALTFNRSTGAGSTAGRLAADFDAVGEAASPSKKDEDSATSANIAAPAINTFRNVEATLAPELRILGVAIALSLPRTPGLQLRHLDVVDVQGSHDQQSERERQ